MSTQIPSRSKPIGILKKTNYSDNSTTAPSATPATSSSSSSSSSYPPPPPPPSSSSGTGGDLDSQELLSGRRLLAEAVKRASVAIVVRDLQEFRIFVLLLRGDRSLLILIALVMSAAQFAIAALCMNRFAK